MLGKFITPDPYMATANGVNNPADPGSWNRYAYTDNDPVNFNDPSGLMLGCESSTISSVERMRSITIGSSIRIASEASLALKSHRLFGRHFLCFSILSLRLTDA